MSPRNKSRNKSNLPPFPESPKKPQSAASASGFPTWKVDKLDAAGPFGQAQPSISEFAGILDFLKELETRTWNEILSDRGHGHHPLPVEKLCPAAKRRLKERGITAQTIIEFKVDSHRRLWGIRSGDILDLLWWDPEHKVYPQRRR